MASAPEGTEHTAPQRTQCTEKQFEFDHRFEVERKGGLSVRAGLIGYLKHSPQRAERSGDRCFIELLSSTTPSFTLKRKSERAATGSARLRSKRCTISIAICFRNGRLSGLENSLSKHNDACVCPFIAINSLSTIKSVHMKIWFLSLWRPLNRAFKLAEFVQCFCYGVLHVESSGHIKKRVVTTAFAAEKNDFSFTCAPN